MKKKNIILCLALVSLFLILSIYALQAREPLPNTEGHGQWVYDENGNHKGCVSPGTDCTWSS